MAEDFDPYHRWLGIAPGPRPPDHYQLLGIPRLESDRDVIASAADRQMAHVRSFQTGKHAPLTQRVLNELAAARVCLLSPDQKARYDAGLQATIEPPPAPPPQPPPVPAVHVTPTPRRRRRAPRPRSFVWLGLGAGVLTGLGATILAVLLFVPRSGKLVIEMSSGDREQATLEIDQTKRDLRPKGPLEFALPRGNHQIVVTRPLYAQFQKTVAIVAGETTSIRVQLRPLARLTIEITGRRPEKLKLWIDGEPQPLTAARSLVVPCEPGMHQVRAESARGRFERTVTVLPEQNIRVPIAILADSRLIGQWQGTVEIDQRAVDQRMQTSQANPLAQALVRQSLELVKAATIDLALRSDGTYTLNTRLGPLTNASAGQWLVTDETDSRVTIELRPQQGAVEYRQLHFDGKDSFRTDLPSEFSGLGQFRCRRG